MPVPALDPGIVAGIHVFSSAGKKDVDGRNKSGHDALGASFGCHARPRIALGDAISGRKTF